MMREYVSRMSGLINDVLDFARGRLDRGLAVELQVNAGTLDVTSAPDKARFTFRMPV